MAREAYVGGHHSQAQAISRIRLTTGSALRAAPSEAPAINDY